ncbi:TPA: site-specific DNA-methyltransferase [Legionella pneumophila subsp. pneumophila]|nr:site-specific DNA-methyltransferase [Legionella pneumophila subsp. pneumophila]
MDSLKMHSKDITEENIDKIAALFPNCITEVTDEQGRLRKKIDFDLLRQELSREIVEGPQERYQLNWPGKRQALLTANAPIAKTLRPCPEESVDFDTTRNLFIEGDNIDALKLLQETYLSKIKMIYIDPPYNTGNDGFTYKDHFYQKTEEYFFESGHTNSDGHQLRTNTEANGRFHSVWLTEIYTRLRLAKNLLSEDGVIFISIDDGEQANLKKLCDEIFGEDSFVGLFAWRSRTAKADVPYGVSNDMEWIIAYGKPKFIAGRLGERKYYSSEDFDERWRLQDLTKNTTKEQRPNSYFIMVNPKNSDEFPPSDTRTWSITKQTFDDYYKVGKIVFPGDYSFLNIKKPAFRVFESEDKLKAFSKYGTEDVRMSISTFLPEKEVGRTEHGSKEIRDLFEKQIFSYPKPSTLIKYFIESLCDKEAIILDFYAGSATTAHATFQCNVEDGGNRKFIMVQLPELCNQKTEAYNAGYKNIAEISKERIRRAGKKIKEENADKEGIDKLDIGFRVLKIDSSNMADVYYTSNTIYQDLLTSHTDNVKPDRTPEDLLFQVLLDWGVDLTLPITKKIIHDHEVFFVDEDALVACFDNNGKITEVFVKELTQYNPLRVVFRDAGFASDSVKINVTQIFKQLSPHTEVKTI